MALKDWKKIKRKKEWRNIHIPSIRIYISYLWKTWVFTIERLKEKAPRRRIINYSFNSKEKALKFAKAYMKKH